MTVQASQLLLFVFLGAVAAGTIVGGPIGDKIGTRTVIWVSILGVVPFTLALPYANLEVTAVLTVILGFVLASAFPASIVFAQELLPGRVGMVSGLFFGLAFGIAGIAAAALGIVADGPLATTGGTAAQGLDAAAGSTQFYCFEISLPDPLTLAPGTTIDDYMGLTAAPAWEFQVTS